MIPVLINLWTPGIEQWLPKWRMNDFRTANGEPVKNLPLILYLSEMLSAKPAHSFRFEKVLAHSGIHGNECADSLAVAGCALPWRPEREDEWSLNKIASRLVRAPLIPEALQGSSPAPSIPKEPTTMHLDGVSILCDNI